MKKFACAFFEFFCMFIPCVCAGVVNIDSDCIFSDTDIITDEIYIAEGMGPITITNYGLLSGPITIASGMTVTFQNFGEITSNFDVHGSATVRQNITSMSDLHVLGTLSGFIVNVNTLNLDGTKNILDMDNFMNLIANASNVEIVSGEFMVDANTLYDNVPIDMGNDVVFYINGIPLDTSKPLINGNSGVPTIMAVNVDPMYEISVNGDLLPDVYLVVVRRTDYSEIMPDTNLGDYLDGLRDENPNDKLLDALDAAPDRKTLNKILSESGRVNPIKLMDAPRSINTFYDSMALDDIAFGVIARPFYIASNDFHFIGGAINVTGDIAKNTVGTIGINGGMLNFNGDYDEYSGTLYGGNFGVRYMDDNFYLRAYGTMSYANFSDINAFDGMRMVQNVSGIGGMGAIDAGLVYRLGQEIKLIPFIGARADYASVLNDTKIDAVVRAGLNANVDTDMDGNKYTFGARVLGQTDGSLYAGIYTDMMSTADGVGGGASVGVLYDDIGLSYKLELNIKFEF